LNNSSRLGHNNLVPTRHPSENFVKYLMTTQDPNMGVNDMVNMMITTLGYPPADVAYLDWLRRDLQDRTPPQFTPVNRYHRPSVKFMRTEGIYGLHYQDESAREANGIITHLRARPLIEELLLGHHHPVVVAKKVNSHLQEHFTADGIEAYRHYYWNVDLLRIDEWATLLANQSEKKSKTLAILQVGPAMAMHQAGFHQEIESKQILQNIQEALYFDFLEWKTQPQSLNKTRAMSVIAKAIALTDERLQESNSLVKDSLKNFEKFRMEHEHRRVIDMRELAPEGNFTGSGARLLESEKKEEMPEPIPEEEKKKAAK
jgi:hypothetical protein